MDHPDNRYFIDYGIKSLSVALDVGRGNHYEIEPIGGLYSDSRVTLLLDLNSPYRYFGESNFGYNFTYGYLHFSIKEQDIGLSGNSIVLQNLGTSAKGYALYATPVIFYNIGDKFYNKHSRHSFKIGYGLGVGYLNTSGDIIFTEETPQTRHLFDIQSKPVSLAEGVFMDYRYGDFVIKVSNFGPRIYQNGFTYQLYDLSVSMGFSSQL